MAGWRQLARGRPCRPEVLIKGRVFLELPPPSPLLVVISGPAGVGKDALLFRLKERADLATTYFAVTATTRPPRSRERDGVDYIFLTEAAFRSRLEQGDFLENAQVYGHHYGVPKGPVREALARGRDVVVKVDVQGAATIKGLASDAVFIFLVPPSWEELERRLRQRNTEASADLSLRLQTARREMESLPMFDYVIVNDKLERAVSQVKAIITTEKCRVRPRRVVL